MLPIEQVGLGEIGGRAAAERELLELLDCCRGLAIGGVVLVHVLPGWFGWQGVHVFVTLSGLGLMYAHGVRQPPLPWRAWLLRRARRILPSYWLVALSGFAVVSAVRQLPVDALIRHDLPAWKTLLLDLLLLRNGSYRSMFSYPNASLWYVPLIAGCYLVFPLLAEGLTRQRTRAGLAAVLASCVAVELGSRALAIGWLDGMPVGYGHGFLRGLPKVPPPLDRLPESVPFQLWAPFGLFPTRLGEFGLGMGAGLLLARDGERWGRALLQPWAGLAGLALWLVGNVMLYAGRWGWIPADLLIAVGLTLGLLQLAALLQRRLPSVFRQLDALGRWSHELFLTHLLVLYGYAVSAPYVLKSPLLNAGAIVLTCAALPLACRLLRRFDRSRWPGLLLGGRRGGADPAAGAVR